MTTKPDLFTNVHKGIRRALFAACEALGAASGDTAREASARARLHDALRYVEQHGANEDDLLLPLLRDKVPAVASQMTAAHRELDAMRERLLHEPDIEALYLAACAFTAKYVGHLDHEERVLEAQIRAALTPEEITSFGRTAVQRTAPADQRMMLGWMLPAMPLAAANEILGRLPAALAEDLRSGMG